MPVAHLEYVDRAVELVEQARAEGIELRILGSLAYRLHCPNSLALFEEMKRDLTDIDFAARHEQRKAIRDYLRGRGLVIDNDIVVATEGKRYAFVDPETRLNVDVFFDELYFCHPIPLRDRLDLDYPTITPTDLLLEKMQIVQINPKDVKDSLVLLLEHPIGSDDSEAIDGGYISQLLAADWGFYYTVTRNLENLRHHVADYGAFKREQCQVVDGRIQELEQAIEQEPKTTKWKMRARIGPRKRWYQEVAEKSETF
jgi:hypothetical protein